MNILPPSPPLGNSTELVKELIFSIALREERMCGQILPNLLLKLQMIFTFSLFQTPLKQLLYEYMFHWHIVNKHGRPLKPNVQPKFYFFSSLSEYECMRD